MQRRSEESLRIYARLNDTTYATWLDSAADAAVDSIRTSNMPALAEAAAAEQQRRWLTASAAADATSVSPADTPQHTHDDLVAELYGAAPRLATLAEALDTEA